MWLDEIYRRPDEDAALCGKISMGGASPAAETNGEHRNMKILRGGGVLRIPTAGEQQLIMRCDSGDYVMLGELDGEIPSGMEAGEVYIKTENAAVHMKNNGRIIIEGELEITGSLSLNGRAFDGA